LEPNYKQSLQIKMARKWSNKNLPGALHFLTSNIAGRRPIFKSTEACLAVVDVLSELRGEWPFKLIAYVLMPDHIHLVVNPRDGRIRELGGKLKSSSSRKIVPLFPDGTFVIGLDESGAPAHQVYQESFKAFPLWSTWMIWQKINYIHSNPLKARLVKSAADYRWSSYRSFYLGEHDPIEVDRDWWWPDDVKKLAVAAKEWSKELAAKKR
jgi:putative transposase